MDRRKSIKALLVGSAAPAIIMYSCDTEVRKPAATVLSVEKNEEDRMSEEKEANSKLSKQTFFTQGEMVVITLLSDIILPKDELSGSASENGVPAFIEFIVKDMPKHQIPMRGGLRWLELQSLKRFEKSFENISGKQRLDIVDDIAYPDTVKPDMHQGAAFFTLMRNLTLTGFYTSEAGVKDIGYKGNRPNQWNGVPDDVLRQYDLEYSKKEMEECISFNR